MSRNRGERRSPVGRVTDVHVVDGDSITCRIEGKERRVRLYATDAPETEQEGGPEAAETLERMVFVREQLLVESYATDGYGRTTELLYPERSGRNDSINVSMIREGQANAYTRFRGMEIGVNQAQRTAQNLRLGAWRSRRSGGERPRHYRRHSRERGVSSHGMAFWVAVAMVIVAKLNMDRCWIAGVESGKTALQGADESKSRNCRSSVRIFTVDNPFQS